MSLIAEQGLAGTTQRRVAARAGVSLASVTYHFATLNDLFAAAFDHLTDESVDRLDRLRQEAMAGRITLADAWAEVVRGADGRTRENVVGAFELLVAAIRQPELRLSATRLLDALNSFFLTWTPEPDPSRSVLCCCSGSASPKRPPVVRSPTATSTAGSRAPRSRSGRLCRPH